MKQLSIEEKARRYDEALKEAAIAYKDEDKHLKATLERIFPALKESRDEWIRKWLIEMIEEVRKANPTNADHNGNCSGAIAWLEKQSKALKVEVAMRDIEEKAKVFTEAHEGEISDEILAQMRGVWTDGIMVPRWVLENVEDTLRIQHNIYLEGNRKETCQVRNVKRDLNCVRKLLGGIELTGSERTEKLIDHKVILTNKPK